jgi:hypothetical protein
MIFLERVHYVCADALASELDTTVARLQALVDGGFIVPAAEADSNDGTVLLFSPDTGSNLSWDLLNDTDYAQLEDYIDYDQLDTEDVNGWQL